MLILQPLITRTVAFANDINLQLTAQPENLIYDLFLSPEYCLISLSIIGKRNQINSFCEADRNGRFESTG
ncbi:MAG: hypothetical protein A2167_09095 [Planctomycetes bacterium RBG_13_46_10]|nr:MAG: hypothetical protein A2167_09095 [Planctomycetes bacterium RBG_13_46_10]